MCPVKKKAVKSQPKQTKEDLLAEIDRQRRRIASLAKKLAAAETAGLKLARCFQWDREEYQSAPWLVEEVRSDKTAANWIAQIRER
jgi:hypothetical protein